MRRPVRSVTNDLARVIARLARGLEARAARARNRQAEEIAAAIAARAPDLRVSRAESAGRSLVDVTGDDAALAEANRPMDR